MLLSRSSCAQVLASSSRAAIKPCPVPQAASRPLRAVSGTPTPTPNAASSARPAFASKPSGRGLAARDVSVAGTASKGAPGTVKIGDRVHPRLRAREGAEGTGQRLPGGQGGGCDPERAWRGHRHPGQEEAMKSIQDKLHMFTCAQAAKVDITCYTYRNGVVRVEDAEATLYAAIDVVCDKLDRKMTKIKEKAIAKGKWPGRAADRSYAKQEQEREEQEYLEEVIYETKVFDREERLRKELEALNKAFPTAPVRRYKVMELDPVSVDDAIDEMEQVGHNFFVYRDMESDQIQVVYRRESEGYGVLIPKKRD